MRSVLAVLIAPAALLLAPTAQAQILSVYGTFSPTHLSNAPAGEIALPNNSGYQQQYSTYWASGVGGGVTFGVLPIGPIRIGLDFRGSTKPGTNGADTAMGGIKAGVHIPVIKIKPYIQGSVGYLATRTSNATSTSTISNDYLAWEIIGGIDYPLAHFVDFRVIEIGGGQGVPVGVSSSPNPSLLTISSGIVVHF
jgi:hypothetical protein